MRFLIDETGIHKQDNQIIGPNFHIYAGASGTAKFSPDGTKYSLYNRYDELLLYDFDRETGLLSNLRSLSFLEDIFPEVVYSSVEWSPNSRFIYLAIFTELYQIDTWEDNLEGDVRLVGTYDGTQNPFSNTFF